MKMSKEFTCCICRQRFNGYGNNPCGAMMKDDEGNIVELTFQPEDRCCDECNTRYVIPGRIYKARLGR